jgi:phage baseplate assembly protein W
MIRMSGMNAKTGRWIDGIEHLKQSIRDILSTPLITRVMRRPYGSRLFDIVDAPMNCHTLAAIHSATAVALTRYEPRFRLQRVSVDQVTAGRIALTAHGVYLYDGKLNTLVLTVEVTK